MPTTTRYGWTIPSVLGDRNLWGTTLNTLFGNIDEQVYQIGTGIKVPGSIEFVATPKPPSNQWLILDGTGGLSRITYATAFNNLTLPQTVTLDPVTNLVHCVGHGLPAGTKIQFSTAGSLAGTGVAIDTTYYVISTGWTVDDFKISATSGGAAIDILTAGTGVHTVQFWGFLIPDTSLTFALPDLQGLSVRSSRASTHYQKANGSYYTGGNVGDVLLDQLQGFVINVKLRTLNDVVSSFAAKGQQADAYVDWKIPPTGDGVNGPPRTGDETRSASFSLLPIIKLL